MHASSQYEGERTQVNPVVSRMKSVRAPVAVEPEIAAMRITEVEIERAEGTREEEGGRDAMMDSTPFASTQDETQLLECTSLVELTLTTDPSLQTHKRPPSRASPLDATPLAQRRSQLHRRWRLLRSRVGEEPRERSPSATVGMTQRTRIWCSAMVRLAEWGCELN